MKIALILALLLNGLICSGQDLFKMVKQNDYEGVKAFEDAVNLRDTNQATALMWAAYSSNLKMVELLIKKGADVHAKGWIIWQDKETEYIYGSLIAIAGGENNVDLLKYLLKKQKIDVDDKEINLYEGIENGWTALHWAAVRGNNESIRYLVKNGADIDNPSETDSDQTALIFAVINDKEESVDLLLELGASINKADAIGNTALVYAFKNKNKIMVKKLIAQGAIPGDKNGRNIEKMLSDTFGVSSADEL